MGLCRPLVASRAYTHQLIIFLCHICVLLSNGLAERESMRLESPEFPAERELFPPTVVFKLSHPYSVNHCQSVVENTWWWPEDGSQWLSQLVHMTFQI